MIEQRIIELTEAVKANTSAILAVLAKAGTTPAPAAEDKPAKAKKETPAPEKTVEAKAEPEAKPVKEETPALPVVSHDELANAIRARLKEGDSFKSQFAALRVEFNVSSITELTDDNRGTFLERVNAIEAL